MGVRFTPDAPLHPFLASPTNSLGRRQTSTADRQVPPPFTSASPSSHNQDGDGFLCLLLHVHRHPRSRRPPRRYGLTGCSRSSSTLLLVHIVLVYPCRYTLAAVSSWPGHPCPHCLHISVPMKCIPVFRPHRYSALPAAAALYVFPSRRRPPIHRRPHARRRRYRSRRIQRRQDRVHPRDVRDPEEAEPMRLHPVHLRG